MRRWSAVFLALFFSMSACGGEARKDGSDKDRVYAACSKLMAADWQALRTATGAIDSKEHVELVEAMNEISNQAITGAPPENNARIDMRPLHLYQALEDAWYGCGRIFEDFPEWSSEERKSAHLDLFERADLEVLWPG